MSKIKFKISVFLFQRIVFELRLGYFQLKVFLQDYNDTLNNDNLSVVAWCSSTFFKLEFVLNWAM